MPAFIYHLGDFDPSGMNAGAKIEQTSREMARRPTFHFERLAATPGQIREWNLPTRATQTSDSRAKQFGSDITVELDAVEPKRLREIMQSAIERPLPPHQ